MTTYAISTVGAIAARAGWPYEMVPEAAIAAFLASDNADHYLADDGRGGHFVGLWGIPVPIGATHGYSHYMTVTTNAATALELWKAAGRNWNWQPAVTHYMTPDLIAYGARLIRMGMDTVPPPQANPIQLALGNLDLAQGR